MINWSIGLGFDLIWLDINSSNWTKWSNFRFTLTTLLWTLMRRCRPSTAVLSISRDVYLLYFPRPASNNSSKKKIQKQKEENRDKEWKLGWKTSPAYKLEYLKLMVREAGKKGSFPPLVVGPLKKRFFLRLPLGT